MKKESSLILEGGGMRGAYTAGVMQFFLEKELELPYVIGVSAGICQAMSYVSKQHGRNKQVTIEMAVDPRYIRYKGILDGTGLFNMDFIFDQIPNEIVKYDYEAFRKSSQKLVAVATDCKTGRPVYLDCHDSTSNDELNMMVRASSSLPLFAPVVKLRDMELLDGGISDSIPIEKAISDGNEKNIVVLTRCYGYRKKPSRGLILYKVLLGSGCKGAIEALKNRYKNYNKALDDLDKYRNDGLAYVIAPSRDLNIKRAEKDIEKLEQLYELGYHDAEQQYDDIISYLEK
ncbi:MAG: patatin family protein [Firmicutes bacterium HGW-Firmicutes-7]|nr:MAG: patatin family protein [Firmicutes bacterium HGW-Firmicutes-7]